MTLVFQQYIFCLKFLVLYMKQQGKTINSLKYYITYWLTQWA